jgi:hypothetical protein
VSAREPVPPPQQRKPNLIGKDRALQTSLQLPGEARWSRPSSIVLSVLVHILLFLVLRHFVWQPAREAKGPVFQVFQLSQPKEQPVPIATPVTPPPSVAKQDEKRDEKKDDTPVVTTAPPSEQAAPLTEPLAVPSTLPPPGAAVTEPTGNVIAPPRTAAERLLRSGTQAVPGATSGTSAPGIITPQQAAAARLANGYLSINDSIAAATAAANSATDWTKTDKNGNKWGVTPGQLHLGSITLPLPFYFQTPPGRRDDAAKAARTYAESNAQAKRMELEETFESRVKAMRKRKDAQRDSARAAQKTGH